MRPIPGNGQRGGPASSDGFESAAPPPCLRISADNTLPAASARVERRPGHFRSRPRHSGQETEDLPPVASCARPHPRSRATIRDTIPANAPAAAPAPRWCGSPPAACAIRARRPPRIARASYRPFKPPQHHVPDFGQPLQFVSGLRSPAGAKKDSRYRSSAPPS